MSFFPGHMFVTSARKDSQPAPHWTPTDVSTPARSLTSVRPAEKASLPAPTFTTTGWPISRLDLIFEKSQIRFFSRSFFRTNLTHVQNVQGLFLRLVICGIIQKSTLLRLPPLLSPFNINPLHQTPHHLLHQRQISRHRGKPLPICSRPSRRKNLSPFSKRIDLILLFSDDLLVHDKIYIYEQDWFRCDLENV